MKAMTAKQLIQLHYNITDREISDVEVIDELVNLRRKEKKGNLDDTQERLVSDLKARGMFSAKVNADKP